MQLINVATKLIEQSVKLVYSLFNELNVYSEPIWYTTYYIIRL